MTDFDRNAVIHTGIPPNSVPTSFCPTRPLSWHKRRMTDSVPRSLSSSSDPLANGQSADPLDFVPLPCRAANGWTAARQRGFIAALCELGLVGAAADAVGMSRQSAYRLRARAAARGDADAVGAGFVAAWDAAIDQGETEALSLALDRAVNGVDEPYFYGGRQRGVRRRYDNRLLRAAMRAIDVRQRGIAASASDEAKARSGGADARRDPSPAGNG
jgi:hypothetical protein